MNLHPYRIVTVLFCFALLSAATPMLSFCAVTATAQLDKSVIRTGESAVLVITLQADGGENLQFPQIPQMSGLTVTQGRHSTSTSVQWSNVNGARSLTTIEIPYEVTADKDGTYTFDTIQIPVGDSFIQPNTVTLSVMQGTPSPTPDPDSKQQVRMNQYGILFEAQLDKKEAYVGEQIQLTFTAYFPINVHSAQLDDRKGQFKNFWMETFDLMVPQRQEYVGIQGQRYLKVPIRKYFLFPLTAGEQTIEPLVLTCEVFPNRGNTRLNMLFGGSGQQVEVLSEPVTIHVKPLPEEGKPQTFTGAVGQFHLESSVEPKELTEGDTVTLNVALLGAGNIRNAPKPTLPDFSKFDAFDPTKKENISVNENGVTGRVDYSHVLLPHDVNSNKVGPVVYSFFNPDQQEYVTLTTDEIALSITPSDRRPGGSVSIGSGRRMIRRLGDDFRFIAVNPASLATVYLPLHGSAGFWLLLLVPLAVFGGAWALRNRQDYFQRNPDQLKSRRAPKMAVKLLTEARAQMQKNDSSKTYAALSKAVTDFISNRWNFACAGLTSDDLHDALASYGVEPSCIERVVQTLQEFDGARFAGGNADGERMKADYKKTEEIITELMRQKKS